MKKNNIEKDSNNLIIIMLLTILLMCSLGYIAYDKYFDKIAVDKENTKENIKETNKEKINYNVDGYFIQDLMNKIIIKTGYNHEEYQLYSKDKVTPEDLTKNYRDDIVVRNINMSYDSFSEKDYDDSSKKVFGKNLYSEMPDEIQAKCKVFKQITRDNIKVYEDQHLGGCGGTMYRYIDKITKTETDDNKIYVYQKVGFAIGEKLYKNVIYKENAQSEGQDSIADIPYESIVKIDDYLDKLNEYKFTFNYDEKNNIYYFESVEKMN